MPFTRGGAALAGTAVELLVFGGLDVELNRVQIQCQKQFPQEITKISPSLEQRMNISDASMQTLTVDHNSRNKNKHSTSPDLG